MNVIPAEAGIQGLDSHSPIKAFGDKLRGNDDFPLRFAKFASQISLSPAGFVCAGMTVCFLLGCGGKFGKFGWQTELHAFVDGFDLLHFPDP